MDQPPLQLAISGASGRMGQCILAAARDDQRFEIAATFSRSAPSTQATNASTNATESLDVIVDFSTDDGARAAACHARQFGAALLVGTTGLSAQTLEILEDTAEAVSVMCAPNTSRGIALMKLLIAAMARTNTACDAQITERHHARKRDQPSGTALLLLQHLNEQFSDLLAEPIGRDDIVSIRESDVPGEHRIFFNFGDETIEIAHIARSRDVFARGALNAAAWLCQRTSPGFYSIDEMFRSTGCQGIGTGSA